MSLLKRIAAMIVLGFWLTLFVAAWDSMYAELLASPRHLPVILMLALSGWMALLCSLIVTALTAGPIYVLWIALEKIWGAI